MKSDVKQTSVKYKPTPAQIALIQFEDGVASYQFRLSCSVIRDEIGDMDAKLWASRLLKVDPLDSRVRLLMYMKKIGLHPFLELIKFYNASNEKDILTQKLHKIMTPTLMRSLYILILMDKKYEEISDHAIFREFAHYLN